METTPSRQPEHERTIDQELADAAAYAPGGHFMCSTFLRGMSSSPPSWKSNVKSKIQLSQSMRICMREEQSYQISSRSDLKRGRLRLFWRGRPNKNKKKKNNNNNITTTTTTRWVAIWDQFLIQKSKTRIE